MKDDFPRKTADYVGEVTNTDIWSGFEIRPDDVFVCTPPKCGTTWTQTLVRMLITQTADPRVYDNKISPWLDCGFRDRVEQANELNTQSHRRCIKTHTPLDGIQFSPDAQYLVVHRHPVDVHFSMRRHVENMKADWLDYLFPNDLSEAFAMFLNRPSSPKGTDDLTLRSFVHHFRTFWKFRDLPNIHFLHYAELSRDLRGQVARLARIMDIEFEQKLIKDIAEAGSFGSMKNNAKRLERSPGFTSGFHDFAQFFSSGTSNKWEGKLTAEDMERYDACMSELVTPEERLWLEHGCAP
ncbi:sulfotransferase domain-containing protein [uncultured Ruegeria sp.]|uniref:sulfotransferase domain-containing protein n=1 Tax=uncultured Ruegeria sp. TaxID=259304 RepID=UPI0026334D36|nr:sulfotransferase domain-containing protein [uncultured Ruegeria sp.]